MTAPHYTSRVSWSADDGEFVGTVAEMPARHRELTIAAAEAGVSMNRWVNDRLAP